MDGINNCFECDGYLPASVQVALMLLLEPTQEMVQLSITTDIFQKSDALKRCFGGNRSNICLRVSLNSDLLHDKAIRICSARPLSTKSSVRSEILEAKQLLYYRMGKYFNSRGEPASPAPIFTSFA
jgi:hypothetical protein